MKILAIAWKDTVIRLRDRKGLLLMLLMPLILTAILGMALDGMINGDASSMPKMKIAVYNGDTGELGKRLTTDVLSSDELKSYITIETLGSETEVEAKVKEGSADAAIAIPAGFSDNVMQAKSTSIKVLQDPGKMTAGQIVESIVISFTDRVSAVANSTKTAMTELAKQVPVTAGSQANFQQIAVQLAKDLQATAESPNSTVSDVPLGSKAVSGRQYYAAAMAAMFLLFNATVGAKMILNERATETMSRLMSTPTAKSEILLGKFFGTLLFSVLQFALFVAITNLLFGVNWGDNPFQTAAIGTAYATAVSGLSMTVAAIVSSEQAADLISGFGIQIMSILGGSMVPIAVFPNLLKKIALVVPNTWALNSFLDIMTGTTWQALLLPITVLLALGAASLTFGTLRLRAR